MISILTAEEILKMTKPGDLFSNDAGKMKLEYRNLSRQWHPDLHPNSPAASEVMAKINNLHVEGQGLIKEGKWASTNFIQFKSIQGQLFNIRFLAESTFELGRYYVLHTKVIYVIEKQHKLFYDNYVKRVNSLKYYNSGMEDEFKKYLPSIKSSFETDEYLVLVVGKPDDVLPLQAVLSHFGGELPDRHVAWILSSLYNLACFLNYNGISHNGITVDNYFISPQHHSGMLLGGWWYAVEYGEKMLGTSRNVLDVMSFKTKQDKTGTYATDLDSIRQVGRELCGDMLGSSLQTNTTIPKAIIDWLLGGSSKEPVPEYSAWGKALDSGYGKRTFVELRVQLADLYKK